MDAVNGCHASQRCEVCPMRPEWSIVRLKTPSGEPLDLVLYVIPDGVDPAALPIAPEGFLRLSGFTLGVRVDAQSARAGKGR